MYKIRFIFFLLNLLGISQAANAQLSKQEVHRAIDDILQTVTANYVFPETAEKAKQFVLANRQQGQYDTIRDGQQLAVLLTGHLQKVTKDLHLRVFYSPNKLPEQLSNKEPSAEELEGFKQMLKNENYGIKQKQVLKGNIGYINITLFAPLDFAADSLTAAVQSLINTDALIIDLRECGGSMDPNAIPYFSGYFFDRPVHLNDLYYRTTNDTTQYWSYGWVPGKKYLDKPVYILTSGRSFSGAEELAYDYKNLKRATLVGEQTRGGANPGGDIRSNDHFGVFVPTGRAINPITKTNWEGVGVEPDTVIAANRALHKAHYLAVEKLWQQAPDAGKKKLLGQVLDSIRKEAPVFRQVQFSLKGYHQAKEVFVAGSFNAWSPRANPMQRSADGWTVTAEASPGKIHYKFCVDGEWILDPANTVTEQEGRYTNSVRVVK